MAQGAPKGAGGGGGVGMRPGPDDGRGKPLSPARPAATGGQEEGKAAIFAPGTPEGQLKRHWRCLWRIRKCFNLCLAGSRPATGPFSQIEQIIINKQRLRFCYVGDSPVRRHLLDNMELR